MTAQLRLVLLALALACSLVVGAAALATPTGATPTVRPLPDSLFTTADVFQHAFRPPPSPPRAHPRPPLGVRVVGFARHLIGVPYVYGGSTPSGFDCSGFVRFVYHHFGIELPHSSYADFGLGRHVTRRALRPGDLVFFDGLGHVGLYVGKGRFIHAPHTGTRVEIDRLTGWYSGTFDGARRLA